MAQIKCPVGFMLFKGGLCTLGRLPIPLLSALGPMRRMFEVLGFAGNIYRRPDTSIKGMQLTDVTSYASRWRHRLLLHWRQLCCTCVNLEYLLTMSPSRLVWRRGLREGGLLLPRSLGPGLAANMKESWRMLGRNTDLLTRLCDSAQRRVRALYEAQGGATKYWVPPNNNNKTIGLF